MGILDQLSDSLKETFASFAETQAPALITSALAKTNLGDLQGIVDQLQQGGLGGQVKSWLGNGSNLPVTPEQLKAAMQSDQIKQIALQLGVPVDAALKILAEHLPAVVDQASPNGKL